MLRIIKQAIVERTTTETIIIPPFIESIRFNDFAVNDFKQAFLKKRLFFFNRFSYKVFQCDLMIFNRFTKTISSVFTGLK